MGSPVNIVNQALSEIGQQVQIASFNDNTAASRAASLLYTQKIQMLSRAAPWDKFRAQLALTQLKATVINGVTTGNPPPTPWNFEYAYPSDCIKARFLQPTPTPIPGGVPLTTAPNAALSTSSLNTRIPFVVGTDFDAGNNPISVILTNLCQAQLVYNRDLSQVPDLWDPLFTSAAVALLGAYLINALARNKAQMDDQIALAKNIIDQARAASANESISSVDHMPDWIAARMAGSTPWAWNQGGPNGVSYEAWGGSCGFPDGQFY